MELQRNLNSGQQHRLTHEKGHQVQRNERREQKIEKITAEPTLKHRKSQRINSKNHESTQRRIRHASARNEQASDRTRKGKNHRTHKTIRKTTKT